MVAKVLDVTGDKDSTFFIIIVSAKAAAAALRSGTSGHGWIYVGTQQGKIRRRGRRLGGGDGGWG